MSEPKLGAIAQCDTICSAENDAIAMKSGALPVFATPSMIALMEEAASKALLPFLEANETSVGTFISVSHSSPSGHKLEITARAEVVDVNGREITFNVTAFDNAGEIGNGTHKRVVVNGEKLVAKANSKFEE